MVTLKVLLRFGLLCCCLRTCASRCRTRTLFPAASRVKRESVVVNPTFCSSRSDARLLFEILMADIHFGPTGAFSVADTELSSLRKTKHLDVICEEIIPKTLPDILRLVSELSHHRGHLHQEDFERTLMTLVFASQKMVNSAEEHQREAWAQSVTGLFRALKTDLTLTD
ncbi:protein FAM180A [Oryzias melastigma]|uniref:Family with sequence similarity 180 member A n=1 Tax=Oryzias melastigma TaxID=30732 RepID=A0A3B3CRE2_ORYME|nr:protein FAM180A [Oryzias melastigma]